MLVHTILNTYTLLELDAKKQNYLLYDYVLCDRIIALTIAVSHVGGHTLIIDRITLHWTRDALLLHASSSMPTAAHRQVKLEI